MTHTTINVVKLRTYLYATRTCTYLLSNNLNSNLIHIADIVYKLNKDHDQCYHLMI